jgi:hypothetical protein
MRILNTILFFLILHSTFYAQLAATLTIENQYALGSDFYFDLYITRSSNASQGDIYLGNADFTIRFNLANFLEPTLSKEGTSPGFCNLKPTNSNASNDLITRINYFENVSTSMAGDEIRINLNGPTPSDQVTFDGRVAKINGSSSTHRLGRFKISGIADPTGTAGLTWVMSNEATTVYTLDHLTFESNILQNLNAIDPVDAALPMDLISFEVSHIESQKSKLIWVTASEQNNEGFSIQRKTAKQDWSEIGFMSGAGTTTIKNYYEFIDHSPFYGINYYRLVQLDYDGTENYSQIESVNITKTDRAQLYPNPMRNYLFFDSDKGSRFSIFDGQGREKMHGTLSDSPINVSRLSSGIHFLIVNGRSFKFLKW